MKNKIILAVLTVIFIFSFIVEPIQDSIDLIAGATSDTYSTPDDFAAASDDEHDDEHKDEEDDD
jgi:hypothetical protein